MIAGYESNRARGLPYINGIFVLTDAATGRSLAIMDGGWITEMRTAGVSGVVLRQVSASPRSVAIVGAGAQARRHLELLLELHPDVAEVRAFDIEPTASRTLLALAGDRRATVASSAEDDIAGADLVITAPTTMLPERLTCEGSAPDALLHRSTTSSGWTRTPRARPPLRGRYLGQYHADAAEHFEGYREPTAISRRSWPARFRSPRRVGAWS